MLHEWRAAFALAELDVLVDGRSWGRVRRTAGLDALRRLLGLSPLPEATGRLEFAPLAETLPTDKAQPDPQLAALAQEERVRHQTFGIGVVTRRDGHGDDAKLTVEFEAGTKVLLARFLAAVQDAGSNAAG